MTDKKEKLRLKRQTFFEGKSQAEIDTLAQQFKESRDMSHLRDYWLILDESGELRACKCRKKGVVDEHELLLNYAAWDDTKDYYAVLTNHDEYVKCQENLRAALKASKPYYEGIDEPTESYKPVCIPDFQRTREVRGYLCKKPGPNFMKCRKIRSVARQKKSKIVESARLEPTFVDTKNTNLVMEHTELFEELGARVEISFEGVFTRAAAGRTVYIVRYAKEPIDKTFIRAVLKTCKIMPEQVGEFEVFAYDKVERFEQTYHIYLDSKINGGADCGICDKVLLIEEQNNDEVEFEVEVDGKRREVKIKEPRLFKTTLTGNKSKQ